MTGHQGEETIKWSKYKETLMNKRLLKPEDFSRNPVVLELDERTYDHSSQASVSVNPQNGIEIFQRMTFNGTQTFNYQGRPSDSDND